MLKVLKSVTRLPVLFHAALAAGSIGWFQLAKGRLDQSYAASRHPVDYMTGQTGFSGQAIKEYYAAMSDTGTLDIYVTTQLIDFGFILGFIAIGLFVCTLTARLNRGASLGRTLGLFAGMSFVVGAACDAIENGWSFVMLTDPSGFADWIAYPYSAFAVMKFGFITLGMGLSIACLLAALIGRLLRKPNIG